MSAFLLYCKDKRRDLSLQFPSIRNTEMSGKLSKMWRESSDQEKQPYLNQEIIEREKYYERMREYNERRSSAKAASYSSSLSLSCSSADNDNSKVKNKANNKHSLNEPPALTFPSTKTNLTSLNTSCSPTYFDSSPYYIKVEQDSNILNSFDEEELEFVRSLSSDEESKEETPNQVYISDSTTCSNSLTSEEQNNFSSLANSSYPINKPSFFTPSIEPIQCEDPLDSFFINAFSISYDSNSFPHF